MGIARFLRTALLDTLPVPVTIEAAWLEESPRPRLFLLLTNNHVAGLSALSLWCMGRTATGLRGFRARGRCSIPAGGRRHVTAGLPDGYDSATCYGFEGLQIEDLSFADETLWVSGAGGGFYSGRITWRAMRCAS